jgi:hypothetical protein
MRFGHQGAIISTTVHMCGSMTFCLYKTGNELLKFIVKIDSNAKHLKQLTIKTIKKPLNR